MSIGDCGKFQSDCNYRWEKNCLRSKNLMGDPKSNLADYDCMLFRSLVEFFQSFKRTVDLQVQKILIQRQ